MWSIDRPPQWVGRGDELAVLGAGAEALGRGEGAVVWVEGEPGIGKSSLVAEALAAAAVSGWQIGWGFAGKLTERLPLRVMLDCLQVQAGSADPRRARAADQLRGVRQGLLASGDASVTGIEVLVGLVDELCARPHPPLSSLMTCSGPTTLRRPASGLAAGVEEAVAAGILTGSGPDLALRHLLIQQALYESMPAALLTALHAEAARELAASGADVLSVAQQLAAANKPGQAWVRKWLVESGPALAARAPQVGAEILRRELDATPSGDETRDGLGASLAWALLAAGSYQEAARRASRALTATTDPVRRAEIHWVLTRAQVSAGRSDAAIATIRQALASAGLPGEWRARMLALLAMLQRAATGDLDVRRRPRSRL